MGPDGERFRVGWNWGRAKRKDGRKSFEDEYLRTRTAADVGTREQVSLDAKGKGEGEMDGVACAANSEIRRCVKAEVPGV